MIKMKNFFKRKKNFTTIKRSDSQELFEIALANFPSKEKALEAIIKTYSKIKYGKNK